MTSNPSDGRAVPTWAVDLVRATKQTVTAYSRFLRDSGTAISTGFNASEWQLLPLMTKANYLQRSPLADLLAGGLASVEIVSSSSGSSGQPFFWPRGESSTRESTEFHRRIIEGIFGARDCRTLVVISFSMGTWIAGSYTLEGVRELARHNPNVSVVTPGISIEDNLQVLGGLAPHFDRTVICGYPPLVFDILGRAAESGVNVKGLDARLLVAGENISEAWRDRTMELISASDPLSSVISVYGTADAGMIGHETPATVCLRRLAADDPGVASELFPGISHLPTLVEIDPRVRYVEEVDGSIVFTSRGVLPLIRYKIGDFGRVLHRDEVVTVLTRRGVLDYSQAEFELPEVMIALYGRSDVAATFYAVNLYPENIKHGIERFIGGPLSGKFVMSSRENSAGDSRLYLVVELSPGQAGTPDLLRKVGAAVLVGLVEKNSEYRRLHDELGERAVPVVEATPYGHDDFDYSIKHRWVAP